jgi:hypothetical protein
MKNKHNTGFKFANFSNVKSIICKFIKKLGIYLVFIELDIEYYTEIDFKTYKS